MVELKNGGAGDNGLPRCRQVIDFPAMTTPDIDDKVLQQMVDIIVREVDPETIILFGSRARGDARPDSDVDLMIVEKEPFSAGKSRRKQSGRLYLALMDLPGPKDILLYSRDEFDFWKKSLNHVVGHASREGRVLYGHG
ncbi:MAG: nucleotidyltransferase domain-containing protein [Sulfurisoma sp.]|nr:nucleotidyltransferase domain-containing protein [Sulfurisoma sp.]